MNVKQTNKKKGKKKTHCTFPPITMSQLKASKPGRRGGALSHMLPQEKQLLVVSMKKNLHPHNHFRMFLKAFAACSISHA